MYQVEFITNEDWHNLRNSRSSEFNGVLRRMSENIFYKEIDWFGRLLTWWIRNIIESEYSWQSTIESGIQ